MDSFVPISKENLKRYPADWKAIRQEVLERAGHKCEQCGVPNHAFRVKSVNRWSMSEIEALNIADYGEIPTYIVLTVAHLNHQPEDCGEPGNRPNLAAWCQRCHLAYDHEHHMRNAHQTRRGRKASGDLFA